jgi:hypothetical protein
LLHAVSFFYATYLTFPNAESSGLFGNRKMSFIKHPK